MNKKHVLIACGTGVATSTVVCMRVKEELEKNNITATVEQCKVAELPSKIGNADLVVTTTSYESNDIPVIRALSFLTGVGMDEDIKKIIEILQ
ncbi:MULTISPECIES: PTS sugar transporter subunit IIB [Enterococcus]|uniref:PTS system, galactitol-specific IIB component n=1 Tax=Candidatus Enterococcus ferrettii TaxID=2815324 RepID=A0ABV0EN33_9ENTE|nr:PTS sugar transporter subunit IIB [Enterococcus sp. 665A]MBO1338344.1 PTS sugar transporter subunit IIB [Enterococcus sp. 665A]